MTDDLERSAELLLNRVGHWSAAQWAQQSRGDRMYALVQQLADLAAAAESRPPLPVPRLADVVLPDQLRVMVRDLRAAPPTTRTEAATHVATLRASL
ncbi:hypothetical protein GCM10009682_14990 [Luedemannella flava]|uniref:Uncharacterized protein n=1 Tax=Luedemannella flava TaxID=349316 RepID=A0ABP4XZK8_9ACTN